MCTALLTGLFVVCTRAEATCVMVSYLRAAACCSGKLKKKKVLRVIFRLLLLKSHFWATLIWKTRLFVSSAALTDSIVVNWPADLLSFSSLCSSVVLYPPYFPQRVHPFEPGPAQGFFLLKGSFSCHCWLFGVRLWASLKHQQIEIKLNWAENERQMI